MNPGSWRSGILFCPERETSGAKLPFNVSMANNIKIIRESKGLSQQALAAGVMNRWGKRVTGRYISALESSGRLTADAIIKISSALKVPPGLITSERVTLSKPVLIEK